MSIATDNKKAREWLMKKLMPEDTADAIIDMDNLGWSEGIGLGQGLDGWLVLVDAAEEVTGRGSDRRNWERALTGRKPHE